MEVRNSPPVYGLLQNVDVLKLILGKLVFTYRNRFRRSSKFIYDACARYHRGVMMTLSSSVESISKSYPYMGPENFPNRFVIDARIHSDIPLRGIQVPKIMLKSAERLTKNKNEFPSLNIQLSRGYRRLGLWCLFVREVDYFTLAFGDPHENEPTEPFPFTTRGSIRLSFTDSFQEEYDYELISNRNFDVYSYNKKSNKTSILDFCLIAFDEFGYDQSETLVLEPEYFPYYCLYGGCSVRMADKSEKKVSRVQVGDWVLTADGERAQILATVVHQKKDENPFEMIQIGELILTKGHPVFLDNCWKRPEAIGVPYSASETITQVYNFILAGSRSSIFINGFEVATLGQFCLGVDTEDTYFGSERVVNHLQTRADWPEVTL